MKKQTFLPCFSGFYESIWSVEDDLESMLKDEIEGVEFVRDLMKRYKVKYSKWEDVVMGIWYNIDYKKRKSDIAEQLTSLIEDKLEKLGLVNAIKFERVDSPQSYNFATDIIDVEIDITQKQINKITEYLLVHYAEFEEFIKDRYTSYDGFWSYHSNDADIWINGKKGEDEFDSEPPFYMDEHKLGAVLQWILEQEDDGDQTIEIDMYYDVETNVYEYIDYVGMIKDYKKEMKK